MCLISLAEMTFSWYNFKIFFKRGIKKSGKVLKIGLSKASEQCGDLVKKGNFTFFTTYPASVTGVELVHLSRGTSS